MPFDFSAILSIADAIPVMIAYIDRQERYRFVNRSLADWLEQLQQVKKMGSFKNMLDMIPGLSGQIDEEQIDKAGMKVEEAIIRSMTKKERSNHLIIGPTRRTRIAKGSGTSVAEVNRLLKKFEKTRLQMKKMMKNRKQMGDMMAAMQKQGGQPSIGRGGR